MRNKKIGNKRVSTRIEGDGRTWSTASNWLERNHGVSLSDLVDELSGRKYARNLSLSEIRTMVRMAMKMGVMPAGKTKEPIKHYPGITWHAISKVLRDRFKTTLLIMRNELIGKKRTADLTLNQINNMVRASLKEGVIPHERRELVKGFHGVTWSSISQRLRTHFNTTLLSLVQRLGGNTRPVDLTFNQIENMVRASLKRCVRPTCGRTKVEGYPGLTWRAVDHTLRRFNTTLLAVVTKFPGMKRARDLSLQEITYIVRATINGGVRPNTRTKGGIKGYSKLTWWAVDRSLQRFNTRLLTVVNRIDPKQPHFSLGEFRMYLQKKKPPILYRRRYHKLLCNGKLDQRCPRSPIWSYGISWRKITEIPWVLTKAEFLKAWPTVRDRLGITSWRKYQTARSNGQLPPGFPRDLSKSYGIKFSHLFEKPPKLTKAEFLKAWPTVRDRLGITLFKEYKQAHTHDLLPTGFPYCPDVYFGLRWRYDILVKRPPPWTMGFIVREIHAYHKKHGHWPHTSHGVRIDDGGTSRGSWNSATQWLIKHYRMSLSNLVDKLSGRKRAKDLTLNQIVVMVRVSLKAGLIPRAATKENIKGYPGVRWAAVDSTLRRFNTTLYRIVGRIK